MITDNYFENNWGSFKTQLKDLLNAMIISTSDIQLNVDDFVANTTYTGYSYRAKISVTGVTSDHYPFISFSQDAIETGLFNGAIVESYNGGVYIYVASKPTTATKISQIKCIR